MSQSKKPTKPSITPKDVSRIQSATAIKNGGAIEKGSFVPRLQRAVEKQNKK